MSFTTSASPFLFCFQPPLCSQEQSLISFFSHNTYYQVFLFYDFIWRRKLIFTLFFLLIRIAFILVQFSLLLLKLSRFSFSIGSFSRFSFIPTFQKPTLGALTRRYNYLSFSNKADKLYFSGQITQLLTIVWTTTYRRTTP